MKLDYPLIKFYQDGWRTAYLTNVVGNYGLVLPIGPKHAAIPKKLKLKLSDLRPVEPGQTIPAPTEGPNPDKEITVTRTKKHTGSKKEPVGKLIVITDKAPETNTLKEGSHAYAIFKALRAYKGRATREQLLDKIQNEKLVETTMDLSKAFSWMVWQLRGKGFLKVERGESA